MDGRIDLARACLQDCEHMSRRRFLGFTATLAASLALPHSSSQAASRDPRFLLVILRGALDGLSAVLPVGDPDFARVRAGFLEDVSQAGKPLPIGTMFALNPALARLAALYAQGQAAIVHAVATPYRERSHFDGQEVLESGLPVVTHGDSGWLNRAAAALPLAGSLAVRDSRALAVGPTVPLVLRGEAPVTSWSPDQLTDASEDTIARLLTLYQGRDPALAGALTHAATLGGQVLAGASALSPAGKGAEVVLQMADGAARLLARPDGPRLAALSIDGWDTHADEKPGTGRLGKLLGVLDQLFDRLHAGLAPVWSDTVIVAATEFGRTVHINGTSGTDHGTATAAFLLGGAVKGGQVIADWPGLAVKALLDGRDLMPTLDLRSVLKPILVSHLGLEPRIVAERVFPRSEDVASLTSILA